MPYFRKIFFVLFSVLFSSIIKSDYQTSIKNHHVCKSISVSVCFQETIVTFKICQGVKNELRMQQIDHCKGSRVVTHKCIDYLILKFDQLTPAILANVLTALNISESENVRIIEEYKQRDAGGELLLANGQAAICQRAAAQEAYNGLAAAQQIEIHQAALEHEQQKNMVQKFLSQKASNLSEYVANAKKAGLQTIELETAYAIAIKTYESALSCFRDCDRILADGQLIRAVENFYHQMQQIDNILQQKEGVNHAGQASMNDDQPGLPIPARATAQKKHNSDPGLSGLSTDAHLQSQNAEQPPFLWIANRREPPAAEQNIVQNGRAAMTVQSYDPPSYDDVAREERASRAYQATPQRAAVEAQVQRIQSADQALNRISSRGHQPAVSPQQRAQFNPDPRLWADFIPSRRS